MVNILKLTHLDENGNARIVDVTEKQDTYREATACGTIQLNDEIMDLILSGKNPKGDVLAVSRVAGIMACKKTSELIPLCHPLLLGKITVDFEPDTKNARILCLCTVKVRGQTGVEMEALTGVSVALLTIYDMCKAVSKAMVISDIKLLKKSGGKSGDFVRDESSL